MKKKILQICDSPGWAIDRLASAVVERNPQFEWRRIFAHPRALERGELDLGPIREAVVWADAIDAQYWRSLSQLLEKIPELKDKPIALNHHNEKNLFSADWSAVRIHVAETKWSANRLREKGCKDVEYIPVSYDPQQFAFNQAWPPVMPAVGYVGRITAWKGLREVARVCRELGVMLKVMGKMDDADYWRSIPEEDKAIIDWEFFGCPDEDRPEFYKNITVYVGNSGSGRETGPLGLVEALASGVPCVTTPCGIAADIAKPGDNMEVVPFGETEAMKDAIQNLLEDRELANDMRQRGWQTIKNYTDNRRAVDYGKVLYRLLKRGDKPWVSVVIPATYDRTERVKEILARLAEQDYPNLEAVVVWDEEREPAQGGQAALQAPFPVREVATGRSGYNLAMARNLGVIEAGGEVLVFCDSRFKPADAGAISAFVDRLGYYKSGDKVWLFGDKGFEKRSFVENWSCIPRRDLIDAGMFNERINEYGGMSQELRSRFIAQGFALEICPEARAEEICKSPSRSSERRGSIIRMKEVLHKLGFER